MKNLIYVTAFAVASISIVACNNSKKSTTYNSDKDTAVATVAPVAHTTATKSGIDQKTSASVKELVNHYLQLKNALAKDNSSDAATAGKAMENGFEKFDTSALTAEQKKSFKDIADDAKEMAEHIGKSAGRLPHQREHFDMLSKDMYDLIKLLGVSQPLYVDYCPMYNSNKGAIWLSADKAIQNPYLGAKMPTCGSIKEELK